MPQLYELVDPDEMTWLTFNGWVNETFHPTEPLAILKYSKRAVPGAECWAVDAIHHCRGLIYNTDSGEIVARPFKKFWNYGEPGAAKIALDQPVSVSDKVDGSLGILYWGPNDDLPAIATAGSFTSDQAAWATMTLRDRPDYLEFAQRIDRSTTLLFEIVYPQNRIVLDYGDRDDLILLGAIDIDDGAYLPPATAKHAYDWPGPVTESFPYATLAEALAAAPRPNAEGLVVCSIDPRFRGWQRSEHVKIKQADYVELHRIVFGLNQTSVYGAIMVGRGLGQPGQFADMMLDELRASAPEEFWPWIDAQAAAMRGKVAERSDAIRAEYDAIVDSIDWVAISEAPEHAGWGSRFTPLEALKRANAKAFAAEVGKVKTPNKWGLFMLFNGQGDAMEDALWIKLNDEISGKVRAAAEEV